MLSLLLLTGLSLLCVVMNVAQIVAGFRSLPIYQTAVEEFGITSLSSFGAIGVIIEGKFILISQRLIWQDFFHFQSYSLATYLSLRWWAFTPFQ